VNDIDRFILSRLESEGLRPSPEANKRTLIRRLSFDLTGLPPIPEEVEAFVRDPSAKAYETLVDRLLASPHFGERMAIYWLDAVRYADTDGFHADNYRSVYPYRDFVISRSTQTCLSTSSPSNKLQATCSRTLPSPENCFDLQSSAPNYRGGWRPSQRIPGQVRSRSGADYFDRLAGLDDGLLRMP